MLHLNQKCVSDSSVVKRLTLLARCANLVADQIPSAEVLGTDLSPIQPSWVPPNCRFIVDDAEDEWLNGDDFDMVHMRTMASVVKDVPKVLSYAYK